MTISVANPTSEIAMWGPTGSGKTWLLHAFGKELLDLSDRDPHFEYSLTTDDGRPIMAYMPPSPNPTSSYEDILWIFQRRPRIKSIAHLISSHTHLIIAHDGKGLDLVQLEDKLAQYNLTGSDCLLLLLDPTGITSSNQGDILSNRSAVGYSKEEYTFLVMNLLKFLEKEPRRVKYMAICVTKIDMLSIRPHDPWQLIQVYFGQHIRQALQQYGQQMQVAAFCVSSVGYLDGTTPKSNYDPTRHTIIAPNQWRPYNVTAPFFWFFDKIERQRLSQNDSSITKVLFGRTRLKDYIPYPSLR